MKRKKFYFHFLILKFFQKNKEAIKVKNKKLEKNNLIKKYLFNKEKINNINQGKFSEKDFISSS